MQIFSGRERFSASSSHKKFSSLLFAGAICLAILTGITSEFVGEVQAFLALVFLFALAIGFNDYKYGILLAIFLLPLSSTQLIPREMMGVTGLNPYNVALIMTAISLFFVWLVQPGSLFVPKPSRYFWLYLGALTLAALHGLPHVSAIPAFYKALNIVTFDTVSGYVRDVFLKPLLILATALLLSIGIRNARRPSLFLIPLFCSAIVMSIAVVISLIKTGSLSMDVRGESSSIVGMHPNELGLLFNMAYALALFCFFSKPGLLWRCMMGTTIAILLIGVTLTFSRGAYLGSIVVTAYFLASQKKFGIMLLGLLLIPIAVLLMPDAVLERAATGITDRNIDELSAGRVHDIWIPLLPDLQSSPIIGHGLSSVLWSHAAKTNPFFMTNSIGHTHSAYIGLLLDFGILGIFVFILFYCHLWRLFRQVSQLHSDPVWRAFFKGALGCIVLLLVQGVTDDRFVPTIPQTYLWLAYGMALGFAARIPRPTLSTVYAYTKVA